MANLSVVFLLPFCAFACSRILVNREHQPLLAARTMDWSWNFEDFLLVHPRGQPMDGGLGLKGSSKVWNSTYGSIVASINGWLSKQYSSHTGLPFDFERDGATEGINEKGLTVHLLYLGATKYGSVPTKPNGVSYMRWVRYLLDTCASVDEAVVAMNQVQISDVIVSRSSTEEGESFGVHVAVEDASGDSAIFEIINGSLQVYHSANFSVMTNDPPIPEQIENLKRYQAFGGSLPLPGNVESTDRFVRSKYFAGHLPYSQDHNEMVGFLKGVIMNVAVPHGAPYQGAGEQVYPTWWSSVTDIKRQVYHWGWSLNPNFLQVDLKRVASQGHLAKGAPTLVLNARSSALVGDVSGNFVPISNFPHHTRFQEQLLKQAIV